MKLVDYAGLMAEENGTIFQEFGKLGLGTPQVFGGACGERDYVAAEFLPSENCVDVFGNTIDLAQYGVAAGDYSIWYPSGFGRDGMFDTTRHYLVWEEADRRKFAEWLLDPARAAAEQNDDPHALIRVDWNLRADSA